MNALVPLWLQGGRALPRRDLGPRLWRIVVLLLLVGAPALRAQTPQPWSGRGATPRQPAGAVVQGPAEPASTTAGPEAVAAQAVAMVGLTVSDMNRSIAFYTRVLDFTKVTDDEVAGEPYEKLGGVFGVRLRVVRLRLGGEYLQLTEYLA